MPPIEILCSVLLFEKAVVTFLGTWCTKSSSRAMHRPEKKRTRYLDPKRLEQKWPRRLSTIRLVFFLSWFTHVQLDLMDMNFDLRLLIVT